MNAISCVGPMGCGGGMVAQAPSSPPARGAAILQRAAGLHFHEAPHWALALSSRSKQHGVIAMRQFPGPLERLHMRYLLFFPPLLGSRSPGMTLSLLVVSMLIGPVAHGQTVDKAPAVLLAAGPFSPDLKPWEQVGQARFAADDATSRHGHRSARTRYRSRCDPDLPATAAGFHPRHPRERRVPRHGLGPFADIKNVRGPYLALEFVNDRGERLAIAHSGAVTGTDEGWDQLAAEGTAPDGTHAARVSLVLHAHGTAWFADPELVRTDRPEPWPELGDRPRIVTIHGDRVIQTRFGGVGFHAFHHVFPASRTELDEVIIKRWRELRPSFARINHESRLGPRQARSGRRTPSVHERHGNGALRDHMGS